MRVAFIIASCLLVLTRPAAADGIRTHAETGERAIDHYLDFVRGIQSPARRPRRRGTGRLASEPCRVFEYSLAKRKR